MKKQLKKYQLKDLKDRYIVTFEGAMRIVSLVVPINDHEGVAIEIGRTLRKGIWE